jgi:tetratricopeptide (TPR) repeat protein
MLPWNEQVIADWAHWDLMAWARRPLPETVQERFAGDQASFDIRFLEDLLVRLGDNGELLAQLGYLYTQVGRYRDGLAVDRRLVALRPRDAIAYYNLACSHSRLKQATRAFGALRMALELGYRDLEHMQADPDLENIRRDPRWNDLVGAIKL